MSRPIRAFILVSILLNLLLGGVMIGHLLHREGPPPGSAALAALPAEKRAALEKSFARLSEDSKEGWRAMRDYREKSLKLLAAEKFDEKSYDALTAKAETAMDAQQTRRAAAVKTLALTLSAEERKALAELLRDAALQWKKGQDCLREKSQAHPAGVAPAPAGSTAASTGR